MTSCFFKNRNVSSSVPVINSMGIPRFVLARIFMDDDLVPAGGARGCHLGTTKIKSALQHSVGRDLGNLS
jgi:hypothetical protein